MGSLTSTQMAQSPNITTTYECHVTKMSDACQDPNHLHLNHRPSQRKLHPDLGKTHSRLSLSSELTQPANLLCPKEELHALWNYVKINGLLVKVDRRIVKTNDELCSVGSLGDRFHPTMLTVAFCAAFRRGNRIFYTATRDCNRLFVPPDPIVLHLHH